MQMDNFTQIVDVLNITLGKFITFALDECVYRDYDHYQMVNWFHQLFLNPNILI